MTEAGVSDPILTPTAFLQPELGGRADEPIASPERATILIFSCDYDRLLAALMIATGAAASGIQVSLYFSFWGLLALKRANRYRGKSLIARIMTAVLPSGAQTLGTSRLNCFGAGPRFFAALMKHKKIPGPTELLSLARELGVRLIVCPVSMEMFGVSADELIPGVEVGGVASYVADASTSAMTLVF